MASKMNMNQSFILGNLVVTYAVPTTRKVLITTKTMKPFAIKLHSSECTYCKLPTNKCICGPVAAFFKKASGVARND